MPKRSSRFLYHCVLSLYALGCSCRRNPIGARGILIQEFVTGFRSIAALNQSNACLSVQVLLVSFGFGDVRWPSNCATPPKDFLPIVGSVDRLDVRADKNVCLCPRHGVWAGKTRSRQRNKILGGTSMSRVLVARFMSSVVSALYESDNLEPRDSNAHRDT